MIILSPASTMVSCRIAGLAFITSLISAPQAVDAQIAADPAATAEIQVERGLQVVVFPNRIRLQYDVGLSSQAATALLRKGQVSNPEALDRKGLMEAFRDLFLPEIQRRCRVSANGEPLAFETIESRIFPKHYVQLSCIYEAPLPANGGKVHLKLVDGSFRGCVGNHLIALKAEDGAVLESSTVPLILSRVPRQSLSNDSAAASEASRRAEAVVQLPQDLAAMSPFAVNHPPEAIPAAPAAFAPAPQRFAYVWWVAGFAVGVLALLAVTLCRKRN